MAVLHHKHHLFIFVLLSILLLAGARLNLDHSDLKAFSTIQKELGINSQRSSSSTPCNTPGVFCERRLSPNSTFVLKITRLVFKSQRLTGFLSPAIGRLSELKELSLTNNQLVDQVPAQIVKCKKLEILELANNQFSGEIPSELSSLVRLRVLDLSSNGFSGNLSFLKHFPNLKVPKSIRSFRNLQFFDFSGNSFLEGPVPVIGKGESSRPQYPKRYILKESTTSTRSKNKISGLAPAPAPSSSAPAPAPHKHKNSRRKLAGWLFGFLAGSVAGSLSGFVFSLLFKIVLAAVKGGGRDKAEDLAFLEKDDGLANLEIIGRGGCGEVFKAELPGKDSKLLNKKMRQIQSEINTVGHIRHRNLLPLLAHVSRPDYVLNQVTEGKRELDWLARHKIAVGVASGLEYLHLSHSPRIIHRDLKPARIADFGLAKAMPDAKTHISTSNVAGTVGYIAPEYHQTLKFTDKCDIYSFGVVLGVLVMGKLPSDAFFQSTRELSLVKWMRNVMISENPNQAIDPKLKGHGLEDQMLLVLKIACFCTIDDPKQRPNSKDVRCMLSQIKH
ncbi:leucine-rich repeat receptor-like serine/threonine/tyrosine-protein kinase SOBIR1 [Populus alba x Populus x berolinensis]|uniref:Leucine-rich repeat receptor-like serine/threonine/tyrosine-protein kinase SOBIR1 n=1 Tax=Populus alba x Populus x berolinensis TaxID=444605 RepID=A0AAD6Q5B0_9ROSI|nr:leucine-rich repeat receptor-like serine/threonine/tyrosine-protein kinase SOBIR1 [Populus alba x Populus x berolinensis]